MSKDREEEKKRGAAGGGFEQGMRSALEKAPGMAAPSWLTMQSAMAGGAAGGAAAASWRWIIGPAAGAALIGGALWLSDPVSEQAEADGSPERVDPAVAEGDAVEPLEWFEDDAAATHEVWSIEGASEIEVVKAVETSIEAPSEGQSAAGDGFSAEEPLADVESEAPAESSPDASASAVNPEADEKSEDWADLPVEKLAAFGVDIDAACVGTEIGFRMAKPLKDVRVLWNFGDGQFSSEASPQHVFDAPGTYDITLSVTRISDGLIRTRTIENLVTIHPIPRADFTWEVPAMSEQHPVIRMRNRSRDASNATWIVDGETAQAGESAAFELGRTGEHIVQLVASSPHGCQSVARHNIEIGNRFGIGGSGRFSPDGDGSYDRFLPRGLIQLEWPFVFRIEDKEGHIVFETTEPRAWDGTLPGDERARPGQTFAWTAVIQGEVGPSYFSDEVVIE